MLNYIPRFNFVYKLQCFQGYLRPKIKVHRVLVLILVETSNSKEYLIANEPSERRRSDGEAVAE